MGDLGTEFGSRLRDVRKIMKLSQKSFAALLGIKQTALSNYEHGRLPPLDVLDGMRQIYRINLNWLLVGVGAPFWYEESDADDAWRGFGVLARMPVLLERARGYLDSLDTDLEEGLEALRRFILLVRMSQERGSKGLPRAAEESAPYRPGKE